MKKTGLIGAAALSTALALGTIHATAEDSDGWQFSVAPLYLWAKAIDAHASAGGKQLPLDLDFKDDILENLDDPLPVPDKIKAGDSWVHPFAGVRLTTKLSDRWSLRARADFGYEDGDNQALNSLVLLDYHFRGWGSAFVGYRYLDIEFDNTSSGRDQYGFDGDQQGPLIGLNFYF